MNLLTANDRPGCYPPGWYATSATPLPPFPPLEGRCRADVCVVGGGYTGLSTALHLAQTGARVVLLEAHRVGFGASGRNGGQVGSGQRLDQGALEARHGSDTAHRLWDLAEDAKALVAGLIARHAIDAAQRPGVAHAAWTRRALDLEAAEAERLARDYGYDRIAVLDRTEMTRLTGSDRFTGGTLDLGASHLHPLRFALGLAGAAAAAGASLHETSTVLRLEANRDGHLVHTAQGQVQAAQVVLACNGYLGTLEPSTAARVMPINNFMLATGPLDRFPEVLPDDHAVADSRFVVNYWRRSEDNRLLFGGGESYGYRFPPDIAALVRKRMLQIYPQLTPLRVEQAWGGALAITLTRMPCFSRINGSLWTASGYSGHGVALATLAGKLIAEALSGDSRRFDLVAALDVPAFPGGHRLRAPLLALAMAWYTLRDRLGR